MVFTGAGRASSLFAYVALPAALSVAALCVWTCADPSINSTLPVTDYPVEEGMYAITRRGLEAAGRSRLGSMVGVGMSREFSPPWPMPLPDPLPQSKGKHTLVLDIDETLIHTYAMTKYVPGSLEKTDAEKELAKSVPLVSYSMLVRPYLKEFLTEVSELFEVVYWTAGTASYCAAVLDAIERRVLEKPPSFYNYLEMVKVSKGEAATSNANYYALSRTQTLESKQYMKYMPLLGRDMRGVLMIDDNVRSFPLTPRHGIKVPAFDADDKLLHYFLQAAAEVEKAGGDPARVDKQLHVILEKGGEELARLEKDTGLLDILPMLRAVAKVPFGEDVSKELDHWRDLEYVKCDDFKETMNPLSVSRTRILGSVLNKRQDEPIPPLKNAYMNAAFVEEMNAEAKFTQTRPKVRSNL